MRALQHCWRRPNRPWWSGAVTSMPGTGRRTTCTHGPPIPLPWRELRSALRCVPGAQRTALMTPGEPTVALFAAGRRYLIAVTVVGSNRVRSDGLLEGDAPLAEPERLIRWLAVTTGNSDGDDPLFFVQIK